MGTAPARGPAVGAIACDPIGAWCLSCGRTLRQVVHLRDAACDACSRNPRSAARVWPLVRLGEYRSELRDWILALKRGHGSELGEALGLALARQWMNVIASLRAGESNAVEALATADVQPIPMPWRRRIERGNDHARRLAAAFAQECGLRVSCRLAQQWGDPQSRRSGAARRRREVDPSFHPERFRQRTHRRLLAGWHENRRPNHTILIDDVRTTGETLREAAEVLGRHRPELQIGAAVLAVSHDDPGLQR